MEPIQYSTKTEYSEAVKKKNEISSKSTAHFEH